MMYISESWFFSIENSKKSGYMTLGYLQNPFTKGILDTLPPIMPEIYEPFLVGNPTLYLPLLPGGVEMLLPAPFQVPAIRFQVEMRSVKNWVPCSGFGFISVEKMPWDFRNRNFVRFPVVILAD